MAQIKTPGSADTVRVGTPPANVGADVTTIAGTVPVKSENLSSADQSTVRGDGSQWRPLESGGGPGTGVDVLQDGTPVVSGATAINFTGDVNVTDGGSGQANVDVTGGGTGGVDVLVNAAPVLSPATALNFSGLVAANDAGGGTANVAIGAYALSNVISSGESPYNASIGELVQVNPTTGNVIVNLPASATAHKGLPVAVKAINFDQDQGTITITPNGSDTIDGEATFVLSQKYESVVFIDDGSGDWKVLATYSLPRTAYYQGDGTAPIAIDPNTRNAFVASTGSVEADQEFTLADGSFDGQTMTIVALTSGFGMVVTVTSPNGGYGSTNTIAALTKGALFLVWRVDGWCTISINGFVNS